MKYIATVLILYCLGSVPLWGQRFPMKDVAVAEKERLWMAEEGHGEVLDFWRTEARWGYLYRTQGNPRADGTHPTKLVAYWGTDWAEANQEVLLESPYEVEVTASVADAAGRLYVLGATYAQTATGKYQYAFLGMWEGGVLRWMKRWKGGGKIRPAALTLDTESVYVSLDVAHSVFALEDSLAWSLQKMCGAVLIRLTKDGKMHWWQKTEAEAYLSMRGLAIDDTTIYWGGTYGSGLTIDSLEFSGNYADTEIIWSRWNKSGTLVRAQTGGGVYEDRCLGFFAAEGALYMALQYKGQLRIGEVQLATAFPIWETAVVKFNNTDKVAWVRQWQSRGEVYFKHWAQHGEFLALSGYYYEDLAVDSQRVAGTDALGSFWSVVDTAGVVHHLATEKGLVHAIDFDRQRTACVVGGFRDVVGASFVARRDWSRRQGATPLASGTGIKLEAVAPAEYQISGEKSTPLFWSVSNLDGRTECKGTGRYIDLRNLTAGRYSLFIYAGHPLKKYRLLHATLIQL